MNKEEEEVYIKRISASFWMDLAPQEEQQELHVTGSCAWKGATRQNPNMGASFKAKQTAVRGFVGRGRLVVSGS